jgi:TPR repeat protein
VEGVRRYTAAATQGKAAAEANMGVMYASGRGGLAKGDMEAERWYQKVARDGELSAQRDLRSGGLRW